MCLAGHPPRAWESFSYGARLGPEGKRFLNLGFRTPKALAAEVERLSFGAACPRVPCPGACRADLEASGQAKRGLLWGELMDHGDGAMVSGALSTSFPSFR